MKPGDLVKAKTTRHDKAFIQGYVYKVKAVGDDWLDVELDSLGTSQGWAKFQFELHIPPNESIIKKAIKYLLGD